MESHAVMTTHELGDGRTVYDLGQNFAGVVQVHVKGPRGAVLRLTPGELLSAGMGRCRREAPAGRCGGRIRWRGRMRGRRGSRGSGTTASGMCRRSGWMGRRGAETAKKFRAVLTGIEGEGVSVGLEGGGIV